MGDRRQPQWLGLDVVAVLAFVALGRNTHDSGQGIADLLETAAPFLGGLVAGWLLTRAWHRPLVPRTGLGVAAATVIGGMFLRRLVFDDGTAISFVVVATTFLFPVLLGWRVAVTRLTTRSPMSKSGGA